VPGREEVERLLAACSGQYRLIVATALYTGLRISELLGLIWEDIDFAVGVIRMRAQLSRAHRGAPATRVPPKTAASYRDVPLVVQLAGLLIAYRQTAQFAAGTDWVFATSRGTPDVYTHTSSTMRAMAGRYAPACFAELLVPASTAGERRNGHPR
jgi:integrase